MLVHRRVTPSIKFAGTHLYTWVERGTVRVKCLAHEHNAMSPARSRTRAARSGVECTNHEATAPPALDSSYSLNYQKISYTWGRVLLKAVFWLSIMVLTQISRSSFKQSKMSLLIPHIYVSGFLNNFKMF